VKFEFGQDVFAVDHQAQHISVKWRPSPENVRANAEDVLEIQADAIVVCAGVSSYQLADLLGERVNVYPVKGYSITVQLNDEQSQQNAPWVSLLDESAKIVLSRLGKDRLRVAGTAEFNGYNRDIRVDRIQPLIDWTQRNFDLCTEHVVPWAGLRPMMPNMMPVVRRGRQERVFYNTGHGHLGWTLSAATAAMISQEIAQHYPV
ncbi:FAD-dependent oxidoreductase, partial [Acinetobacter variabilis]|uniref:FAD-dependent oxidoreductase n=1 Tax=Acinetobacter variabilis TaxID=70346 RepID=UPI0028A1FE21